MLAENWKTAEELQITEDQRLALIATLHGLERKEFKDFSMAGWCNCICGTAHHLAAEAHMLQLMSHSPIIPLFVPSIAGSGRIYATITQTEAAQALRSYLTTGDPQWRDALGKPTSKDILKEGDWDWGSPAQHRVLEDA